jgi:hypothetical protein
MAERPKPRVCRGCKKPRGTYAYTLIGYWHRRCFIKAMENVIRGKRKFSVYERQP